MPNGSETLEGLSRSDLELIIGAGPRVPESVKQAARAIIIGNLATDTAALLAALERRSQALRQCIADLQTLKAFLDSGPFDDLAGKVSRILDAATDVVLGDVVVDLQKPALRFLGPDYLRDVEYCSRLDALDHCASW